MAIQAKPPLPIIISGTGPAALLLGHALLRTTPPLPFRLYERDLSMTHRTQGYRFVINGRGVKSCRDVLSPEHFALLRATCGDNDVGAVQCIDTRTGALLPGWGGKHRHEDEQPLTADRTLFRQTLFRGLEEYTMFGKEVVGYEDAADAATATDDDGTLSSSTDEKCVMNGGSGDSPGGVLVRFADGSTVRGALLVGAEGAFSRVHAQLMPQVPLLDSEMRMICGKTPLTPTLFAALGASDGTDKSNARANELLQGMRLLVAPPESPLFFMFQPMRFGRRAEVAKVDPALVASIPSDYVYWALALRSDQPEAQSRDWRSMDGSTTADLAENLTKAWLASLRPIVTHQDRTQTMSLRSAVMPVPLLDWRAPVSQNGINGSHPTRSPSTNPMVTLMGDSAHAMPPTGGLGATTALTDAAVLGAALSLHGVSQHALEAYEAEMRDYGTRAIEMSVKGGKMFVNMRDLKDMRPIEH